MKILMVPSWYPPNGGRFFQNQANALASLGHKVDVLILQEKGITTKINPKINFNKSEFVNEISTVFYRIPKLNALNTERFIKKYKKLLKNYLLNNKPDIILVQSVMWAGIVVSEISLINSIPYVIYEHRSIFLEKKRIVNDDLFSKIKYAFNNATSVLAVSNGLSKALKPFTSKAIQVVPNMLNVDFFKRNQSIIKNETFTFIAVGNLVKLKGFDILLKAFSLLSLGNNIQLHIVGVGKEYKSLQKLILELGLHNKVNFLAYLTKEELVNEYNQSHVFVSSSKHETFGMTIVEAMACELPIVATKTAGALDLIKNNENGILAELNDVQSLFNSMNTIYKNYSNFAKNEIRQSVVQTLSEQIVVEIIEKELIKCLNKKQ